MLFCLKKEGSPAICYNIDGHRGHYISDGEMQELPWWSSGWNSILALLRALV